MEMIRKLDELGRIVIPIEMRNFYEMKEGDKIEIIERDNEIILRKYKDTYCPQYLKKCVHTDNFCSRCGLNFKEYANSFKKLDEKTAAVVITK